MASGEVLKVFVRVRPQISAEVKYENAVRASGNKNISVQSEKFDINCSYDRVFDEISDQVAVFENVRPLLQNVLAGYNACIFAYGQTSAGKSYTMLGPQGGQTVLDMDQRYWGILPRAAEFLFGELADKAEEGLLSYKVKASFLQIYNECLYDLLRESGPAIDDGGVDHDQSGLKIREIPRTGKGSKGTDCHEVYVSGLSEFRVQTGDDVLRILEAGIQNRMTRSTDYNATSSRSHAILQLTFEIESYAEPGQTILMRSKLSLVDLAGSEKMQVMSGEMESKHLRELTSINKSLSSLGNVIAALSSKTRTHIPYRDSKLTRLLQDSLGGNTRTILIACIAPTVIHASESVSTLQFADRAKNVMLRVRANTVVDDKALLARAEAEIARLKLLLKHALKKSELGGFEDGDTSDEMSRLLAENGRLKRENEELKSMVHRLQEQQGRLNESLAASRDYSGGYFSESSDRERDAVSVNPFKRGGGGGDGNSKQLGSQRQPKLAQSGYLPTKYKPPPAMKVRGYNHSGGGRRAPGDNDSVEAGSDGSGKGSHRLYGAAANGIGVTENSKGIDGGKSIMKAKEKYKEKHQEMAKEKDRTLERLIGVMAGSDPAISLNSSPEMLALSMAMQRTHQAAANLAGTGKNGTIPMTTGVDARAQPLGQLQQSFSRTAQQQMQIEHQQQQLSSHQQNMNRLIYGDNMGPQLDFVTDDEADIVDVKKLRAKLDRAKTDQQLQSIEAKLLDASAQISTRLREEEDSLDEIRSMRQALEHQLKDMMSTEDGAADGIRSQGELPVRRPSYGQAMNGSATLEQTKLSQDTRALQQLMIQQQQRSLFAQQLQQQRSEQRNPTQPIEHSYPQHPLSTAAATIAPSVGVAKPLPLSDANEFLASLRRPPAEDNNEYPPTKAASRVPSSLRMSIAQASAAQALPSPDKQATQSFQPSSINSSPAVDGDSFPSEMLNPAVGGKSKSYGQQASPASMFRMSSSGGQAGVAAFDRNDGNVDSSVDQFSNLQRKVSFASNASSSQGVVAEATSAAEKAGGARAPSLPLPQVQDAQLAHTKEDIGKVIQMFSFRFNRWDNIELVDFEPSRGFHKCKFPDKMTQWLDLKKKPVRAIPLDGERDNEH